MKVKVLQSFNDIVMYEEGELERLFNEMIEREGIKAKIVESYHDTGNWAMCIEKLL